MKSFLALFLIAIISCTPANPVLKEKDPVEIIKCILSNPQIMDELGNIIVQIEEVIQEGDLSGLTSLLNIFSMIEEVKSCFEGAEIPAEPDVPVDPQPEEEVVLRGPIEDLLGCVVNAVSGIISDVNAAIDGVQSCWDNLPQDEKDQIKEAGVGAVSSACSSFLSDHPIASAICSFVCSLV